MDVRFPNRPPSFVAHPLHLREEHQAEQSRAVQGTIRQHTIILVDGHGLLTFGSTKVGPVGYPRLLVRTASDTSFLLFLLLLGLIAFRAGLVWKCRLAGAKAATVLADWQT
jgi:hypothetical protein